MNKVGLVLFALFILSLVSIPPQSALTEESRIISTQEQLNKEFEKELLNAIFNKLKAFGKLGNRVTLEEWRETEQAKAFTAEARGQGRFTNVTDTDIWQWTDRGRSLKTFLLPDGKIDKDTNNAIFELAKMLGEGVLSFPKEEARLAVTRGMAAAKQKDWKLAIKYFRAAQQKQPSDPKFLFNLALANDKAGNRETIAIPWYQAYLAAAPDASNEEVVEKRIIELDVSLESRIRKLLLWDQNIVEQYVDDGMQHLKVSLTYGDIARAQYKLGDIDSAYETLMKVPVDYWSSDDYMKLAKKQIQNGDLKGAEKTINMMPQENDYKVEAYLYLARGYHQQKNRDATKRTLSLAEKTAGRIPREAYSRRYESYKSIAKFYLDQGNSDSARRYFKDAYGFIHSFRWTELDDKNYMNAAMYKSHASILAEAGYTSEAKETFNIALKTARAIKKDDDRSQAYAEIAAAQAKAGYEEDSRKTLVRARKDYWIQFEQEDNRYADKYEYTMYGWGIIREIAVAEARIFGAEHAIKTIENLSGSSFAADAYLEVVRILLERNDIEGAKATAGLISDNEKREKSEAYLDIVRAQLDQGDFERAIKTAGMICAHDCYKWQLDRHVDTGYKYIIESQAKNGNIKQARETASKINEIRNRLQMYKIIADVQVMSGSVSKSARNEEVAFWANLANRNSEIDFLADFGGYLKSIKDEDPEDASENIVRTLSAMGLPPVVVPS